MQASTQKNIKNYHEARIHHYGPHSVMALGWNTHRNQQVRFEVLSEIDDLSHSSILDLGSGRGDLSVFLRIRFDGISYTGIEQLEAFHAIAVQRYGHLPHTSFIQGNFWNDPLPETDYILISGALNYKHSDPGFIYSLLPRLFQSAKKGMAFNLLSQCGYPPGDLVAYDADEILRFCQTFCPKVVLREDYLEGDFTVYLHHV